MRARRRFVMSDPAGREIHEFAPAKINLALHVTGRRADGYHLLDSLVVFAGTGDRLRLSPGAGLALEGPMAADLPGGGDNLVMRAADLMGGGIRVVLDKQLPVASGMGGGSADAAAVLRAMARMGRKLPDPADILALGADLPVCLRAPEPMRMGGIGGDLTPLPPLPRAALLLVNPRVPVPTGPVFAGLERRDNPPLPETIPRCADAADLAAFLRGCRNDLEAPARALVPQIAEVLGALADMPECLLARMSGSGASCFGLFDTPAAARTARAAFEGRGWWLRDTTILTPSAPQSAI